MKDDELVKALRDAQEKYKNDIVSVGRIRIDEMARDCADRIEQLAKENVSQQCKILMLSSEVEELRDATTRLTDEYDRLRNEHCNLCGRYKMAHEGACNGCRWHRKGE